MARVEAFLRSVERRALVSAEIAVQSADDAMDIVQDTMLRFVERYAKRPEEEWRPLFFTVLHNRITDQHRQGQRWKKVFVTLLGKTDDDDYDPIDAAADPDAIDPFRSMNSEQIAATLDRVLPTLPARQRQVFLLRMWEGFDIAQSAQVLGVSEGSIKTHLHRALTAIKRELGDLYEA